MNKLFIFNYINFFSRPRKKRVIKKKPNTKYLKYKEQTRKLIAERLVFWNQFYGFTYNKVFIKNQKTRWGSCSKKGNLNFSYRIIFLPQELVDYIVVHELCHLGEFNHSSKFWVLVTKTIPNYKKLKNELKNKGALYTNIKN